MYFLNKVTKTEIAYNRAIRKLDEGLRLLDTIALFRNKQLFNR
jgi:hypothetical protein